MLLRAERRSLEVLGWDEADERLSGDRARLLNWLDEVRPGAVAVTAAQRPRRTATAARPRAADAELLRRRIAVAPAPTRAQAEAGGRRYAHVRAGWDYFRDLRRRGYEPLPSGALPGSLGQASAVLEVYPHAGFVTVLGGTPPPRSTREGLRLRVLTLRRLGLRWDDYYDAASLDALMAAFTAWRFLQGLATCVGDDRDGCLWLPVTAAELRPTYPPLTARAARTALARLTDR